MSDNEQAGATISIDASEALDALDAIQARAEALDQTLTRLQDSAVRTGNKLSISAPGGALKFQSYDELTGMFGGEQGARQLSPRLDQTITEIQARRQEIARQVQAFDQVQPAATRLATPEQAWTQYQAWEKGGRVGQASVEKIQAEKAQARPQAQASPLTGTESASRDRSAPPPVLPAPPLALQGTIPSLGMVSPSLLPETPPMPEEVLAGHANTVGAQPVAPAPLTAPRVDALATPWRPETPPAPPFEAAPTDYLATPFAQRSPGGPPAAAVPAPPAVMPWSTTPTSASPFPLPALPDIPPQVDEAQATRTGDAFARALTRAGGNGLSSLIRAPFEAAGMGSVGTAVGDLARPAAGLLSEVPVLGGVIGGVAAVAGIGLGVNALEAKYASQQQAVTASTNATPDTAPNDLLGQVKSVGWQYNVHETDAVAAAQKLSGSGTQADQLPSTLAATFALQRVGAVSMDTAVDLSKQYVKAGFSGKQIGDAYGEIDQTARNSGVSMDRLIAQLKELGQSAGIGAVSVRGLAAAQQAAGSLLPDVSQALAPAVGAQGEQAMQAAAIMHVTPEQFTAMQAHPEQLWDQFSKVAKEYDTGSGGVDVAEIALGKAGLDLGSLSGPRAAQVVQRLATQGPRAAQDYYNTITQRALHDTAIPTGVAGAAGASAHTGVETGAELLPYAKSTADSQTTLPDKLSFQAERWTDKGLREKPGTPPRSTSDPRYAIGGGADISQGSNSAHIQPTRPLQSDNTVPLAQPVDASGRLILPAPTPALHDNGGDALGAGAFMGSINGGAAQGSTTVQHQLAITVTVQDQRGNTIGSTQVAHQVNATQSPKYQVDVHRRPVAYQAYHVPPPPAEPGIPRILRSPW